MKIVICFLGLVRTLEQTFENIKENLYDNSNSITTIFVTWETENTDIFKKYFPDAKIFTVPVVTKESTDFLLWKKNSVMHFWWLKTFGDNNNALFMYYRQIYLWEKSTKILDEMNDIDIIVRARTDITTSGKKIKEYYNQINDNTTFFPNSPRFAIVSDKGCPDQVFFGSKQSMLYLLKIKDNVNYLYNKYKQPVQPESSLYCHVVDKELILKYMDNSITIIREKGFSKEK